MRSIADIRAFMENFLAHRNWNPGMNAVARRARNAAIGVSIEVEEPLPAYIKRPLDELLLETIQPKTEFHKFECSICIEELPATSFPMLEHDPVPYTCQKHLTHNLNVFGYGDMSEFHLRGLHERVCKGCLSRHFMEQFRTRGAEHVACIKPGCRPLTAACAWKYYAAHFLDNEVRTEFNYELAKNTYSKDKWICPGGCPVELGWTALPRNTRDWPHVECPQCQDRFCATCGVLWHEGISCRDFKRANRWQKEPIQAHPLFSSRLDAEGGGEANNTPSSNTKATQRNNFRSLREMQHQKARMCPRCEAPIVKDGGCNHMQCSSCELMFTWGSARKIYARKDEDSEQALKKVKAGPLRCIGAWIWRRRIELTLWLGREKKNSMCEADFRAEMMASGGEYQWTLGQNMTDSELEWIIQGL